MFHRFALFVAFFTIVIVSIPAQFVPQQQHQVLRFQRILEPNHQAFSLVIPEGWVFQGGLQYPQEVAGGVGQMMTPKTNFTVTSPDGMVGLEWFEETVLWSWGPNPPPAAPMLNQTGFYNGMPIVPMMDAVTAIEQLLIPAERQGMGMRVVEHMSLTEVAQAYAQTLPSVATQMTGGQVSVDVGLVTAQAGQWEERYFAILRYFSMEQGSIWSNPVTCAWHYPVGQRAQWEPTLAMIFESLQLNPQWVATEIQRQGHAGQTIGNVQQLIQQIDNEINQNRAHTNAAIQRTGALSLIGMQDRRDPTTNQPVPMPDWVQSAHIDPSSGQIIASDDPNFDPGVGGWQSMDPAVMYRPGW